jgi:type IV secretory pathway VirB4 component
VEKATLGWERLAAMPVRFQIRSRKGPRDGQKLGKSSAQSWTISPSSRSEAKHSLKLAERSLNVYENKGSEWKELEEAGRSQKAKGGYVFVDGVLCFKLDNKFVLSERGKAFFKTEGTKRECL